jgi:hypothetical protein
MPKPPKNNYNIKEIEQLYNNEAKFSLSGVARILKYCPVTLIDYIRRNYKIKFVRKN